MDLEIQSRPHALEPEWRDLVERQSARLSNRFGELLRLHVTVRHGRHHRLGAEEVAMVANVPGETLRAGKRAGDVAAAVHAAFDAMEVELDRHRRTRRHSEQRARTRVSGAT